MITDTFVVISCRHILIRITSMRCLNAVSDASWQLNSDWKVWRFHANTVWIVTQVWDDLMIFKHTKDGAPAKFEGKPMSAPLRAYIKVKWSSFSRGLMIFRKILCEKAIFCASRPQRWPLPSKSACAIDTASEPETACQPIRLNPPLSWFARRWVKT